jgi:hypothetical protein
VRQAPVVDPDLIRALDVGQAAYIYRGGVTYVQVKRLVTAPAALPPPAAGPAPRAALAVARAAPAGPGPALEPLPDVSAVLDEAFGAEPTP